MRTFLAVFVLVSGASAAYAIPVCDGSTTLLQVASWSIEPIDSDTNTLSVTLANTGTKDIRMIDGSVGFEDALGGHIASYSIDRDAAIPADGQFEEVGRWGPFTFERLLNLEASEVAAYACVRSVLYDDGTKEEF